MKKVTILPHLTVPCVYMAGDVMILMRAILYPLGSLEGVGPEIETLYMALLISKLFCRKGCLGWGWGGLGRKGFIGVGGGGKRVRKVTLRTSYRWGMGGGGGRASTQSEVSAFYSFSSDVILLRNIVDTGYRYS